MQLERRKQQMRLLCTQATVCCFLIFRLQSLFEVLNASGNSLWQPRWEIYQRVLMTFAGVDGKILFRIPKAGEVKSSDQAYLECSHNTVQALCQ